MALGIGASTLLFSVIYGVLIKPLPWPHADRLVLLKETRGGRPPRFNSFSNAAYHAWREDAATIEGIAGWSQRTVTLADAGELERIRVATASASLFQVLGARPLIGSLFDEKDEIADDVVVLAESLWRQRFGADPRRARTDRAARRAGPPHRRRAARRPGLSGSPDAGMGTFAHHANLGKQLVDVRRHRQAEAGRNGGASRLRRHRAGPQRAGYRDDHMAIFGGSGPIEISATPLQDALTADVRRPLVVLFIAVGLLLVTATTNVASLQLARATTRVP